MRVRDVIVWPRRRSRSQPVTARALAELIGPLRDAAENLGWRMRVVAIESYRVGEDADVELDDAQLSAVAAAYAAEVPFILSAALTPAIDGAVLAELLALEAYGKQGSVNPSATHQAAARESRGR